MEHLNKMLLITILLALVLANNCECKKTMKQEIMACKSTEDCVGFDSSIVEDIQCQDFKCMCDGELCKLKKKSHSKKQKNRCSNNDDCWSIDENTTCTNETCLCIRGYKLSEDTGVCVKESNDPCVLNADCNMNNTICVNEECQCDHGYKKVLDACVPFLGKSCFSEDDCAGIEFATCLNDVCVCQNSYIEKYGQCKLDEHPDAQCRANEDCIEMMGINSHCSRGNCACNNLHWFNKAFSKCVRKVKPGHPCESNEECMNSMSEDQQMDCNAGKCTCKPPYHLEDDTYCISKASTNSMYMSPLIILLICFKVLV